LGFVYLCQERVPEAYKFFARATDIRPNHGKSLIGMAVCHFSEGRWEQSYDWAVRSVQLGGSHFMSLYILAKTEKVLGRLEDTEEHFKKAEELLEKTTEVDLNCRKLFYARGNALLANIIVRIDCVVKLRKQNG
jgi:tetratricopeptide (TPR) repeat protein